MSSKIDAKQSSRSEGNVQSNTFPKLRNIDADLHSHSLFSDTEDEDLNSISNVARDLGLSTVAIADHVRQRWDDVDFYNKDAYTITTGPTSRDKDWLLADNMHILRDVVGEWMQDVGSEGVHLGASFEQDYESWNEDRIEDFLREHKPPYVPLSVHYVPLDRWKKAKYFRMSDFDDLTDGECAQAVENYFDQYEKKIEFGNMIEENHGIRVIHTHLDGLMRNENLRPYTTYEHFDRILGKAADTRATIEINARVMRKLSEEYERLDEYEREEAKWFANEVLDRAVTQDLDYVVSSDAHSRRGRIQNLQMADRVLEEHNARSPSYEEFMSRGPASDYTDSRTASSV